MSNFEKLPEKRKLITFDLNTANLRKFYPQKNINNAYKDIRKILEGFGFEHRQYSVYISQCPLSLSTVTRLLSELWKELPWLKNCADKMDVGSIDDGFDFLKILKEKQNKTLLPPQINDTLSEEER